MKQICLYLLLAWIVHSNHHLYLPLYLNLMRWGLTCFLWSWIQSRHITQIVEKGRWIFAHSLLCGSIPTPSSWPRSETWTLRNREEQFYDNSSRRCLTQSARLHLLRRSSWPLKRNNILPSNQKENHQKHVTDKCKNISPIGNWNKSAGGNSRSRVCVRDK